MCVHVFAYHATRWPISWALSQTLHTSCTCTAWASAWVTMYTNTVYPQYSSVYVYTVPCIRFHRSRHCQICACYNCICVLSLNEQPLGVCSFFLVMVLIPSHSCCHNDWPQTCSHIKCESQLLREWKNEATCLCRSVAWSAAYPLASKGPNVIPGTTSTRSQSFREWKNEAIKSHCEQCSSQHNTRNKKQWKQMSHFSVWAAILHSSALLFHLKIDQQ